MGRAVHAVREGRDQEWERQRRSKSAPVLFALPLTITLGAPPPIKPLPTRRHLLATNLKATAPVRNGACCLSSNLLERIICLLEAGAD